MDDLDLQIFFGEFFIKCKNEEEVDKVYDKLLDNLDICRDERLEELED